MNDNDNVNDKIICKCYEIFNKKTFTNHFKNCEDFKNEFKDFDLKVSLLLKQYINIDNLILIQYLVEEYLKLIKQKIKEFKYQIKEKQRIEYYKLIPKEEANPNNNINRQEEKNKEVTYFWDIIAPTALDKYINNNKDKSENNDEQSKDENQYIDKKHIDNNKGILRTTNNNIDEKNQEQIYSKPQLFSKNKEKNFEKSTDVKKLDDYEIKTAGSINRQNYIDQFEIEILAEEKEAYIIEPIDEIILSTEEEKENEIEPLDKLKTVGESIKEIKPFAKNKEKNIAERIFEMTISAEKEFHNIEKSEESVDK